MKVHHLLIVALLSAPSAGCGTVKGTVEEPGVGDDSGGPVDGADSGDDTGATATDDTAPDEPDRNECTEPNPLPVDSTTLSGFTQAEDFVFDADGYLVSVDVRGNLVGINQEGDKRVILPRVGDSTSGMHLLPGGDFVFSDASTGTLWRVSPDGAAVAVLSGLAYPNGIEVDPDGFVYVSEQSAGRVWRIDPDTGAYEIIARGLHNPNGLQFSTAYATLYVGSFGAGTVHAVELAADGVWEEPRLVGYVPSIDTDAIPTPCDGLAEGDACVLLYGGVGACSDAGEGALSCEESLDTLACAGLAEGDPCMSELLGAEVESLCTALPYEDDGLFCPRSDADRIDACVDAAAYGTCRYDGASGYCYPSWEGVYVCMTNADWYAPEDDCDGLAEGDACFSNYASGAYSGVCVDYSYYGYGLWCDPWYGSGERGGLDGIAVDACDNVYVTEYISGKIYRFDAGADSAELVRSTRATWIPNLHFGNGVGGWEEDVLYVLDRESAKVYGLEVGVLGVREAYQPPGSSGEGE